MGLQKSIQHPGPECCRQRHGEPEWHSGQRAQQGVEDLPAQAQIRSHGHPVAPAQRLHCCAVAGMSLNAIESLPRLLKSLPVPGCLEIIQSSGIQAFIASSSYSKTSIAVSMVWPISWGVQQVGMSCIAHAAARLPASALHIVRSRGWGAGQHKVVGGSCESEHILGSLKRCWGDLGPY